jgi:hypothetical protein
MKKALSIVLSAVLLFSMSAASLVSGAASGYGFTNYQATVTPTIDGTNSPNEWTDLMIPPNLPATMTFREKWTWPGQTDIWEHILIESLTDTTNDTGDILRVAWDCSANGGSTPQTDDMKIEWVGNTPSGFHVYKGTGTGWAPYTGSDAALGSSIIISEAKTASPLSSTPHWVIEISVRRSGVFDVSGAGYAPWVSAAVYDASNAAAGVQAWPPNSTDNPNNWAIETGSTEQIPESFTIATIMVLSSFAVVAGIFLLKKHPIAKINKATAF